MRFPVVDSITMITRSFCDLGSAPNLPLLFVRFTFGSFRDLRKRVHTMWIWTHFLLSRPDDITHFRIYRDVFESARHKSCCLGNVFSAQCGVTGEDKSPLSARSTSHNCVILGNCLSWGYLAPSVSGWHQRRSWGGWTPGDRSTECDTEVPRGHARVLRVISISLWLEKTLSTLNYFCLNQ